MIGNVFNVLGNHGFLRDQGVLTLETVREFYRLIREKPKPASMKVSNLLDFCPPSVEICELDNQPVITLMREYSDTGEKYFHVVVLHSYSRDENYLTLWTIDSLSEDGETVLECPIMAKNGRKKLDLGGKTDKWCLGSDLCYVLYLN